MITLDATPLIRMLGKLWGEPLRPFHTEYRPVIFSAILNRDDQLTPWQRQPHIDQRITAIVYLNPEEMCGEGTGLYRHRPTGPSRVPIGMTAELAKLAQQYGCSDHALRTQDGYAEFINRVFFRQEYSSKENSYINDGNEYWELIYRIDMKPNRLVIFDGRCFIHDTSHQLSSRTTPHEPDSLRARARLKHALARIIHDGSSRNR